MAYNIGQFRRPQLGSYSTPLTMTLDIQQTNAIVSGDSIFQNPCGNLQGDNILNNQNCYYLRFGVQQRQDSEQTFYLKLRKTTETEDNEQLIDEFTVGKGSRIIYFETIISPNSTYDQIVWELRRIAMDYSMINPKGKQGRIMDITANYTYTRLINLLTSAITTDKGYLTKIGIQGPPALLMCINKEQIRIGKTGIYEINNENIQITFIGIVPRQDSDYFIIDYEY